MNDSESYMVKVKNGAGWRAYHNARLQISVGQAYHEGEKLKATLAWCDERFDRLIICVNDTLQRHNMEFAGASADEAFAESLQAGKEWISRNQPLLDALSNAEIIRWETWRRDPTFETGLMIMERMFTEKQAFRKDVIDEVDSFWERALKRGDAPPAEDYERFKTHSIRYLLEECAIFQMMFARDEAVDIYPGSTLLPCKIGPKQDLGVRGYTRIDFRRKAA